MNNKLTILILILLPVAIASCHRNRLKSNQKDLVKEIIQQEKENSAAEKAALEKKMSETGNKTSGGIRLKENRSVDPQRLPILIDISGTQNNTTKLKLSDLASSVRYVKLQTPPDTLLLYDHFFYRPELESNIRSDDEQIIFQGLFGITRFNMKGEYQETIWKNETGIRFYGKGVIFGGRDFYGVMPHIPVSLADGNIYYQFSDGQEGNGQIMKYKPGTNKNFSPESPSEIQGQKKIPGDTLFNKNQFPGDRFNWFYGTGNNTWAGINNKWNAGRSGALIVTFNNKGDTLCQFTDYDRIVNFTHSQQRGAARFVSYSYNGLLTIKQEYNDTVFRLIPPNRLLPAYIIDFGALKANFIEGMNPGTDLSEKFMINSICETDNYLFIRYTRNNDSPNNRTKNAVKFFNLLFDKKQGKFYHQPGFTLLPEGISNDLDGGLPFWPDFITPHGEMMKLVSGKVINDYLNSAAFKAESVTNEKRQKLITMASELKNTDMVIMFIK